MKEAELRARVCAQAREWLDAEIKEADGSHREIIDLYNQHRLPGTYKMNYADPWCACFVSAVGMAVGLGDVILPHVNCDGMIEAYKARGRWIEDDGYLPTPGDVIFYDWQDDGRGNNAGSSDHVGLVVAVEGSTITVVEGNKSDAVGTRTLQRDGRFIRGFAVPDYESAVNGTQEAATAPQSSAELLDRPEGAVDMSEAQEGAEAAPVPMQGAPREICVVALPVLRYGDSINNPDEAVKAAQLLLIGRGYRCGPWGADGEFGTATHGGVLSFQRTKGLAADGVIGAETWRALLGVAASQN